MFDDDSVSVVAGVVIIDVADIVVIVEECVGVCEDCADVVSDVDPTVGVIYSVDVSVKGADVWTIVVTDSVDN